MSYRNYLFPALGLFWLLGLFFQVSSPKSINLDSFDTYEEAWTQVDSLNSIGQYATARELVQQIYEKAGTDGNKPQYLKSVSFLASYISVLEEGGVEKTLIFLEEEIDKADGVSEAILRSMTASHYVLYLQAKYWQISERTETAAPRGDDLATWTTGQLESRIAELFLGSVEDPTLLKVPVGEFKPIISELEKDQPDYRPTIYDVLAHRAIEHFAQSSSYLNEPAYRFYLDDPAAYAEASEFAQHEFTTPDSTSFTYRALLLYQDVLQYHADQPKLRLDADIQRMQFVHNKSVLPDKGETYLSALNQMTVTYAGQPELGEVLHLKAKHLYEEGSAWRPGMDDDAVRFLWRESWKLCKEIQEEYKGTYGASQAAGLQYQLEQNELNISLEKIYRPDEYLLAAISFRNLPNAHFRLIAVDDDLERELEDQQRRGWEKQWQLLRKQDPVRSWSVELPKPGDFHSHTTEIGMEPLQSGRYILLSSTQSNFKEDGFVGFVRFQVSGLVSSRRISEGKAEVLVLNRDSGAPVTGATVEVYTGRWNSVSRRTDWNKTGTVETGKDGFATYQSGENVTSRFHISHGNDHLYSSAFYDGRFYQNDPRSVQQTQFFMDRGIYRPGQTVYFKGLLLEKDPQGHPSILPNQKVTITFRDANYQVIEEKEMISNAFGTVEGTFVAPQDRLPGQMHLVSSVGGNSKYFRVEEYKRPKFEVTFKPVEGDFKLDEEVIVSGEAIAFAGNALDEVLVNYRVVREVRFPWWAWYWRRFYSSSSNEIARGTTTTDVDGTFKIPFTAVPDRTVPADQQPTFSYTVYADVVDGTGETHSSSTIVQVGYVGVRAALNVPEVVNVSDFNKVSFTVQNLNGSSVDASGTILLQEVEPPMPAMRSRYWEIPDMPLMAENVFRYRFPDLPFGDEAEPLNWEAGKPVWTGSFNTADATELTLDNKSLEPGYYRLTLLTRDKDGKEVKAVHSFQLVNPKGKKAPAINYGWTHFAGAGQLEPGDEAEILLGGPSETQYFLVETVRAGRMIDREWVTVKGQELLKKEISEADRGTLKWIVFSVHDNRQKYQEINPQIPWSNKELDISFRTFRDQMLPGSEERWEMVIKGPEGAAAAAEMVATMYDASLDQIVPYDWGMPNWPIYFPNRYRWNIDDFGSASISWLHTISRPYPGSSSKQYRYLQAFGGIGYNVYNNYYGGRGNKEILFSQQYDEAEVRLEAAAAPATGAPPPPPPPPSAEKLAADTMDSDGVVALLIDGEQAEPEVGPTIPVRTNLNETVFFMPELRTDREGNVVLSFTMNEALTKWKFLAFAHTKELEMASLTRFVQTQKPLMVQPNPPRFYRERDEIEFTAKVVNLSEDTLRGNAHLELVNPMETVPVYKWLDNPQFNTNFDLAPGRSTSVSWRFKVPDVDQVPLIEHTVVAAAGDFSDAERDAVPVLSNRDLVTESLPLAVRGKETKTFRLDHLANYQSNTLSHVGYTLEFTSNPAWYAVQALPYLMEYPYECTEQIFSRYYANSLASSVANSQPRIREVFESWKGTEALESPLSRNEELKSALLAETPWVLQAQSEAEQRRNIGLLFDLQRMAKEQAEAMAKLQQRQLPGGGFAWFPGGRDNWYITQYIVEGLGHLDRLGVESLREDAASWTMVKSAVGYIDRRLEEHYDQLLARVKDGKTKMEDDHLDYIVLHYLYTRSFFLKAPEGRAGLGNDPTVSDREYLDLSGRMVEIVNYYRGQAEKYWTSRSQYGKGMIALALKRMGRGEVPALIVKALREQAIVNDELGAYWNYQSGYYWYQHTTETHSLMIELFSEVAQDEEMVELLKIWLLKNKQTTHWRTTKATANAVYALLMFGENWLAETQQVQIQLGEGQTILQQQIAAAQENAEGGTGYFKTRFDGDLVSRDMANISVSNPNAGIAWGAVYWQYLEDLDKIERYEETPLQLVKQVYRVEMGDRGEELVPLSDGAVLHPGDKLKIRIELRVDRAMEYVHMKDMRASGFEPIETLSRYKWQEGLGYYESPRDVATDFFISYLPKGTYVFEYPLRVVHRGDFSNGITTIQCMYAPEFTSHSEGIRVTVE